MNAVLPAFDSLRRHGVAGSLRRALRIVAGPLRHRLYLQERHIWYRLDLAVVRPHPPLPTGFALDRTDAAGLGFLERLESVGRREARRRLAGGADLWLLQEAGRAAFCCWIFRARTPVLAARGGWLQLPAGTACLEDSFTATDYRGRGLAPAVWSRVADALASQGLSALITKVAEDNLPSRRAVEKAGFQAVALMRLARLGPRTHVDVRPLGAARGAAYLSGQLAR